MEPGSHLKRTVNSLRTACSHSNSSNTRLSRVRRPEMVLKAGADEQNLLSRLWVQGDQRVLADQGVLLDQFQIFRCGVRRLRVG